MTAAARHAAAWQSRREPPPVSSLTANVAVDARSCAGSRRAVALVVELGPHAASFQRRTRLLDALAVAGRLGERQLRDRRDRVKEEGQRADRAELDLAPPVADGDDSRLAP